MDTHKITVGLAAFGALVLVYVVYVHFHRTPQVIQRDVDPPEGRFAQDANTPMAKGPENIEFNVRNPVIKLPNDDHRVTREIGWRGDMYVTRAENLMEVEQPYLNIYDPDFTCRITADMGSLRYESDVRDSIPKDATFTGNVQVKLLPEPNSPLPPCAVYLDQIVFVSEQSRFSSDGKVRFESAQVQLEGQGLECVYNGRDRRIEYFWLRHLDSLRIKVPEKLLFFGRDEEKIEKKAQAVAHPADPNEAPQGSFEHALAAAYYSCQVRGNTLIRSPQQIIYAERIVDLVDLVWPGVPSSEAPSNPADDNETHSPGSASAERLAAEELPNLVEVMITCDRGVMVAPNDVNTAIVDPCGVGGLQPLADWRNQIDEAAGQAFFHVQSLQHKVDRKDTLAQGPLELSFFVDDALEQVPTGSRVVPVTVSAQGVARYEAEANRILLSGGSRCTLLKEDPNAVEQFTLEAPRMAIELLDEAEKTQKAIAATNDIKHLRAEGGQVMMRMTARMPEGGGDASTGLNVVTGVEMTCRECDYSPAMGKEFFEALGPGDIFINNAIPQTANPLSPGDRPYYAALRGFETLKYHIAENRIVADGQDRQMLFQYLPLVNNQVEQRIRAQANHVELTLSQDEKGSLVLERVNAIGDVFYEDGEHTLFAYWLLYDNETKWMELRGEGDQPCYVDGVPYGKIEFNLDTNQLKTDIPRSGSVILSP
jgi:hypothetical protein